MAPKKPRNKRKIKEITDGPSEEPSNLESRVLQSSAALAAAPRTEVSIEPITPSIDEQHVRNTPNEEAMRAVTLSCQVVQPLEDRGLECPEWILTAANVLNSAAFVMRKRPFLSSRYAQLALGGYLLMLVLCMLTGASWIARMAALQVKADFEASVRTLTDQTWMFTADLDERLNSLQRSFDEHLPASHENCSASENFGPATAVSDEPSLPVNPLQEHLPQVVALLAAGYQCSSATLLALQNSWQEPDSKAEISGPLRCFDSSVPTWAQLAAEKSTGTQCHSPEADPTVPVRNREPTTTHNGHVDRSLKPSSQLTVHQITSLPTDPIGPLLKIKPGEPSVLPEASIRLVDSSIPYDSSLWRGVKSALWKWRKRTMLQRASEALWHNDGSHSWCLDKPNEPNNSEHAWLVFEVKVTTQRNELCFRHGHNSPSHSASSRVAIDAMAEADTIRGGDESLASTASWTELVVQDLVTPGEMGAQSCVQVQLPVTDHDEDVKGKLLRIRFLDTFGVARYVCIYGLAVLLNH